MKIDPRKILVILLLLVPLMSCTLAQDGDLPEPIVLPDPSPAVGGGDSGSITIAKVSSKANTITDTEAWWQRNGLEKPEVFVRYPALTRGTAPGNAPANYQGLPLMAVLKSGERRFFVYGEQIYKARYLLAEAPGGGEIEFAFDAAAYGTIAWAQIVDSTLYLSNNPGNLSATDGGGAQIFAIDLETNRLKWASEKKRCHGQFLVIAGSVICAYGFTGEPDFIYVLDRFSGELSQTVKLKTAANWMIEKDGKLYVRCYNTDDVYKVEVRD